MKIKTIMLKAVVLGVLTLLLFSVCKNAWMEDVLNPPEKTTENGPSSKDYRRVTFESNDGSGVEPQTVLKGEKAICPDNPTKQGFGFVNWYGNENLNEPPYDFNTPVTKDITLYAKWSANFFTVHFAANGGIPEPPARDVGEGGILSEPDKMERSGFAFDGWYTDNNTFANQWDFANDKVIEEFTLYAKWITLYTVTFNTNDGGAVESQIVRSGEKAARPSNPEKPGFGFVDWYTDNGVFNNAWDFANTAVSEDITLYAKWSDTVFTVEFESNEGSAAASETVGEGGKASKPNPDPTRDGWAFDGWYRDDTTFADAWDFEKDVVYEEITLYAKWLQLRTVTFNTNGGGTVASQSVGDGRNANAPADPTKTPTADHYLYLGAAPTAPGFTFGGWYKEAALINIWDFALDTVTADTTLYAQWTGNFIDVSDQSGANDVEKAIAYVKANAPEGAYTLHMGSDENVAPQTLDAANFDLTIIGMDKERTIQYSGAMYEQLFNISDKDVRLAIGENITLKGITGSAQSLVLVTGGIFTMEDGSKITGHETSNACGAVFVTGSYAGFNMNGGAISGNKSTSGSYASTGGMAFLNNGTVTMKGGSVTGNTAGLGINEHPADVWVNGGYLALTLSLSETAKIGSVFFSTDSSSTAPSITLDGSYNPGVLPAINLTTGNTSSSMDGVIDLWKDKEILKAASGYTLTSSDAAKFDLGSFYTDAAPSANQPISSTHKIADSGTDIGKLVNAFDFYDEVAKYENALTHMIIEVPSDITLTKLVTIPERATADNVTLTIRSKAGGSFTLKRNAGLTGRLFTVSGNAHLILENITIDGNKAAVTNANGALVYTGSGSSFTMNNGAVLQNNASTTNGGAIMSDSTVNINNGKISGNDTINDGGGVYINGGVMNMYGGEISGNTSQSNGAGVFVRASSAFTMRGGEISDNTSTYGGGGVHAANGGEFTMTGGRITANNVINTGNVYNGAGVNLAGGTGAVTLGGTAVIKDNTKSDYSASNMYLVAGRSIVLHGAPNTPAFGMEVWVQTAAANGVIVNSLTDADYQDYFRADDAAKIVVFDNGTLVIVDTPDGSAAMPFLVTRSADLEAVGRGGTGIYATGPYANWTLTGNYRQTADITLDNDWIPIGTNAAGSRFAGSYNGGGYRINNIIIDVTDSFQGMFAYIDSGGAVRNLDLLVEIYGGSFTGGIAGYLDGAASIIENCSVSGKVSGGSSAGGVAGQITGGTVKNCYTLCQVDGSGYGVGGIVGNNAGTVENCFSTSNVSGYGEVGGIVGAILFSASSAVRNCYSMGNVSGTENVGGVAGSNASDFLEYCYATGQVSGGSFVGGVVGTNSASGTVQNCVALSASVLRLSGSDTTFGCVAGENNGTLINNYSRDNMTLTGGASDLSPTGKDGAAVTAADYEGADSVVWWGALFSAMEWTFSVNRLPTLQGFPGIGQNPTVQ